MSLTALGAAATLVTATTTALADAEPHESGLRSGLVNTFHEFGGALGVAVLSSLAAASLLPHADNLGGFTRAYTGSATAALVAVLLAALIASAGKAAAGASPHAH